MRLLSICTSSKNCSVAILEDDKIIKEFNTPSFSIFKSLLLTLYTSSYDEYSASLLISKTPL